jgi:hypothetical protein
LVSVDPNDITKGVIGYGSMNSGSGVVSTGMVLAGTGAAGIELQWGEQRLATNGRLYSKFWANGTGRSTLIGPLARSAGAYFLVAGTVMDLQALQDGDITEGQFYWNLGLGVAGTYAGPEVDIGVAPIILTNNLYTGGIPALLESWAARVAPYLAVPGGPVVGVW